MARSRFLVPGVIVILGCSGALISADEVTYFRQDNGVAADSSALTANFGSESNLVWRVPLKSGISSPCVHGDRIFVTTFDKQTSELATVALDRTTGATLWTKVVPTERIEDVHQVGSPASCTPACDGKRVYSFFGSYGLLCHTMDGELLWERQLGSQQFSDTGRRSCDPEPGSRR